MSYIYHGVPNGFKNSILYPLFELEHRFPKIYIQEVKKYNDHPQRKVLPYKDIPKLNCKRGEVLHCSSIHPNLVFQALKSIFPDGNRSVKFFKIPVKSLKHLSLAYFDMNVSDYEFGLVEDPDSAFNLIEHDNYVESKVIPKEAIDFFCEWRDRGESGAPAWGKIPHVFIKGSIDVTGYEIIDWRDAT